MKRMNNDWDASKVCRDASENTRLRGMRVHDVRTCPTQQLEKRDKRAQIFKGSNRANQVFCGGKQC